ncbi:MAG TPA: DUF1566 domain-containing protein [Planctomycetes bacterium]|nr:DUF1566 domain-containing protein [Planctomycetota bacterium]
MKRIHTRILVHTLGLLLALILVPLSSLAQVPHDTAYQGRLTDAVGAPLVGLVDLQLRIFDVPATGTALYMEDHAGVVLDDNGAFTVRLGTGSLKVGTFDGALFSGVNRYLEVVVDGEVLAPRQPVGSVPYALVAEDVVTDPATSNVGALIAATQGAADDAVTDAATAQATADAAQVRVASTCAAGSSIRAISADGTVTCQEDTDTDTNTTYSAGSGLNLLGTTFSVDTALNVDGGTIENTPIGQTSAAPVNASTLAVDGNAGVNGGTLSLGNGTSNLIDFGNNGVAPPADGSAGWKLRLHDGAGVNQDYGLGIESSTLWLASNTQFKFYIEDSSPGGTYVNHMTLTETGMDLAGSLKVADDITFGPDGTSLTAAIAGLGAATDLEACADGLTVADHDTGLLWERKTGTFDPSFPVSGWCETVGCPNANDVNNRYYWSLTGTDPDGGVFTDFLAKLNDNSQPVTWTSSDVTSVGTQTSGCFAGHCDWRLPNSVELQTIMEPSMCSQCIDPLFGPFASISYWSASSRVALGGPSTHAWACRHGTYSCSGDGGIKDLNEWFVRAVRAGSCSS